MDRPRRRLNRSPSTPTTSPRVGSMIDSGQSRQAIRPQIKPRRSDRRAKKTLRKRLLWGTGLVFLVWWFLSPIQRIDIGTSDDVETKAAIDQYFATSTNRNLLINASALETVLKHSLAYATDVKVQHDAFLSKLTVTVARDTPAIRWQSRGVQYTLSRQGIALYQTSTSGEEHLPLIIDTAAVPVELKTKVVPIDFVDYLVSLESATSESTLRITERSVREATREVEVKFAKRPYRVILSTLAGAGEQLQALQELERYLSKKGSRPSHYIDLRIPDRAYWK
jgi:cell division septal protein FtsQ